MSSAVTAIIQYTIVLCIIALMLGLVLSSDPNCADPSSYTEYNQSTEYKGLNDDQGWDRNKSENCDLSALEANQSVTCGDCDFKLVGDTWYRFSKGPYVKIAEFSDNTACPSKDKCNGHAQLSLIKTDVPTSNENYTYYGWMLSNSENYTQYSKCDVLPPTLNESYTQYMVESYNCVTFILYRFFHEWENNEDQFCGFKHNITNTTTNTTSEITIPVATSLCMDDTVTPLTLQVEPDMKYYRSGDSTPLTCTATRSPTPPYVTWTNSTNHTIPTQLVETASSVYTHVYSLDAADYSAVSCVSETETKTMYSVEVVTEDKTGTERIPLNVECRIKLINFQVAEDNDLYMIQSVEGKDEYYTKTNKSIVIDQEGGGTFRLTLKLTANDTIIPATDRSVNQSWRCGIRDSITLTYITSPFIITLNRVCGPGEGFNTSGQCSKCENNTFSEDNECNACPSGQTSDAGSTDKSQCKCPANTFYEDKTECKACPEGQESDAGSTKKSQCTCPDNMIYEDNECKKKSSDPKVPYIIGGTVAVVFVIALIAGIISYRRRKNGTSSERVAWRK